MEFIKDPDGIYTTDNELVLKAHLSSINTESTAQVPYEPVEAGAFTNDSKLATPKVVRLVAQVNILEYSIKQAIAIFEGLQSSTSLYNIVADGVVYANYTIAVALTERSIDAPILRVPLTIVQIRITTSETTQSKIYANASQNENVRRGQVNTTTANAALLNEQINLGSAE